MHSAITHVAGQRTHRSRQQGHGQKNSTKRLSAFECLMGLTPGSTVPVVIDTRAHRITDPRPGVSVVSEPVHCLTCRLGSQFNLQQRRDRCTLLIHVNRYLVAKPSMAISAWPKVNKGNQRAHPGHEQSLSVVRRHVVTHGHTSFELMICVTSINRVAPGYRASNVSSSTAWCGPRRWLRIIGEI